MPDEISVIRITAPHFVAGVVPHNGRVVNAAPILRYMIHWDGKRVAAYCKAKGWTWERVMQDCRAPLDATSPSQPA